MSAPLRSGSALLCALSVLSACSPPPPPPEAVPQVLTVLADPAVPAGSERILAASVAARHESPLGFRTAGRVVARKVEVGQVLAPGAVIGELDATDYALSLRLAEDQERAAEVDLSQARRDAERFGRLGAEGALGSAEEERQRSRAQAAAARLDQARHQRELAQRRIDYAQLHAPFGGVVTQVQFEPGLTVAEGQPVLTLADPREREVLADIPLDLQAGLSRLQASAGLPQDSHTFPLVLRELSPQANPAARTVRARFRLAPGSGVNELPAAFGLGRAVDLHLRSSVGKTSGEETILPAGALVQAGGTPFVYRVDTATLQIARLAVEVLDFAPDTVRVRGIPAGTRIVAAGAQKLHEGMKVAVLTRSTSGLDLAPPAGGAAHP